MARYLKNTSVTLRETFYVDGTATDAAGAVTIGITDYLGTTVVASGTATSSAGSGVYTYLLTPQTAVNRLTVTWSGTWSGVAQTLSDEIEIVGGHLFTEAEARAAHASGGTGILNDASTYSDADIAAARDGIADELERICGVSFVPRYRYQKLAGSGEYRLDVDRPRVDSVLSASITGVSQTVGNIDPHPELPYLLHTTSRWTKGTTTNPFNVVVTYDHGYRTVPHEIKQAALKLLRDQLITSNIPDRAKSQTNEIGTLSYATANAWNEFGIPMVDQTLRRYSHRSLI